MKVKDKTCPLLHFGLLVSRCAAIALRYAHMSRLSALIQIGCA
jgi:hypothetical protein